MAATPGMDSFEEQKREHPNSHPQGWEISDNDIAAETEAFLRVSGCQEAISMLLRWKPKHTALQVASILSNKLLTFGDETLLEECLNDERIKLPWKLFLLTPLAFTRKKIDISILEVSLEKLLKLKFINLGKVRESYNEDNFYTEFLEIILTACEVVISRGGNKEVVIRVLEKLSGEEFRHHNRLSIHQTTLIDLSLRAFTLLENLLGRECVLEKYLIIKDEKTADNETKQKNNPRNEEKNKLESFIGRFIRLYNTRARIILGLIPLESIQERIKEAIDHAKHEDYRLYREHNLHSMRKRAALSICILRTKLNTVFAPI